MANRTDAEPRTPRPTGHVPRTTAALLACCLLAGPATAQPSQPEIVTRLITLEGKQVPLPDGNWVVAGRGASRPFGTQDGPPAVASVALVRLVGTRITAAVLVQTNHLDTPANWGHAPLCEDPSLYFAHTRYGSEHDGSCAYAAYVGPERTDAGAIDPAWRDTLARGWQVPNAWVDVVFRIADRRDTLQVRYLFDPAVQGGLPLKPPAIRSLGDWATARWDLVDSGFRNRIPADTAAAMPDWSAAVPDGIPIRPSAPEPAQTDSQLRRLGIKMVTYRVFGTLTDLTVNYLWIGSLPSASGLAVFGGIASSSLYFVHEYVWGLFEKPSLQAGLLPGVGHEGAPPSLLR